MERHLWTKNPHDFFFRKIKKLALRNFVNRHLRKKNPDLISEILFENWDAYSEKGQLERMRNRKVFVGKY